MGEGFTSCGLAKGRWFGSPGLEVEYPIFREVGVQLPTNTAKHNTNTCNDSQRAADVSFGVMLNHNS